MVKSLDSAKKSQPPERAWRVSTYRNADDFEAEGIKSYMTKGGSTFGIDRDGDIVAVCGNANEKGIGKALLAAAVARGGTHLDSFDGNIAFYMKCGFEPVSGCAFNDQDGIRPDDWVEGRDKPESIVIMKYTGKSYEELCDVYGDKGKDWKKCCAMYDENGYDDAKEYLNQNMQKDKDNGFTKNA